MVAAWTLAARKGRTNTQDRIKLGIATGRGRSACMEHPPGRSCPPKLPAAPAREQMENFEFARSQFDAPLTVTHLVSPRVDRQAVDDQQHLLAGSRFGLPPDYRPHASDEFPRTERLRDIVVRSQFEAGDDIGLFAACGDHDDRNLGRIGRPPKAAADLQAVDAGKHQIEQQRSRHLAAGQVEAALTVRGCAHRKPGLFEVVANQFGNILFVFDDDDRAWFHIHCYRRSDETFSEAGSGVIALVFR